MRAEGEAGAHLGRGSSAFREPAKARWVARSMLQEFIGDRKVGLVLGTATGRPDTQQNIIKRALHPAEERAGVVTCSFHAFRRFRVRWLRKQLRNRVITEDLLRFWIGHSDRNITDKYSKVKEDVEFR